MSMYSKSDFQLLRYHTFLSSWELICQLTYKNIVIWKSHRAMLIFIQQSNTIIEYNKQTYNTMGTKTVIFTIYKNHSHNLSTKLD